MPLQATSGAASYDGFGGGVAVEPVYIEQIFSTYLYTGNGSTQTITNGIDLSGKGGMVWQKVRTDSGSSTQVFDTNRGVYQRLATAQSNAQFNWSPYGVTAFNNNGFTIADTSGGDYGCNGSPGGTYAGNGTYASWTFRKQPKFFDVVTYTGDGTSAQTVPHNLGSTPGMVIIKVTSEANDWIVWHRGLTSGYYLKLNTTAAQSNTNAIYFFGNGTTTVDPTSTVITLGGSGLVSGNGKTYVAYIFAHDAGGFGLTGTDNVISCGSYSGSNPLVTLGWEPQFLMLKRTDSAGSWFVVDNMRGFTVTTDAFLNPNLSSAESSGIVLADPTATGFQINQGGLLLAGDISDPSGNYIYIAIRRGPMKVPTDATKVFAPIAYTGSGSAGKVVSGSTFPPDLSIFQSRAGAGGAVGQFVDRLRGGSVYSAPSSTAAEGNTGGYYIRSFDMDGVTYGTSYIDYNASGTNYINWMMKRAPSFFDEVCYTGTGSAGQTYTHNLGAVPELMIVKSRSYTATNWSVYVSSGGGTKFMRLDGTLALTTSSSIWNDTDPTSSVFTVGTHASVNQTGETYVAYLFATCAGVSKVGSYTGTATTKQIDCGFTGGARFVLIKRTDSTGSWYVWDSSRGIVSGNDPYLLLNSTAAEVTNTDYIDTYSAGFEISSTAPAEINASGGSFIFLAIS